MSLTQLHDLPVTIWEAHNALLTSSADALGGRELEATRPAEWTAGSTAQTVGAVFTLFDMDGQRDRVTGDDLISRSSLQRLAAHLCERATDHQLATLSNCAERVGEIMQQFLNEIGKAADVELTDRHDHGQHWISDDAMTRLFPTHQ